MEEFNDQSPPALRIPPRRLFWKYVNRDGSVAGGGLLVVAGLVVLVIGGLFVAGEVPYLSDGVTVEAQVTQKWQALARAAGGPRGAGFPAHGGRRSQTPHWFVTYEFRDEMGQVHQGTGVFSLSAGEPIQPGRPITIEYVRAHPA